MKKKSLIIGLISGMILISVLVFYLVYSTYDQKIQQENLISTSKLEVEQTVNKFNHTEYQVITRLYKLDQLNHHRQMVEYLDDWCKKDNVDSLKNVHMNQLIKKIEELKKESL